MNDEEINNIEKYYNDEKVGVFKGHYEHETIFIQVYYTFRFNKFKGNEFIEFEYSIGSNQTSKSFKTFEEFKTFVGGL